MGKVDQLLKWRGLRSGRSRASTIMVLLALALGTICLGACGSDLTVSPSDASTSQGGSASFAKDANKEIVTFGHEGEAAEKQVVSRILMKNLKARASGDWKGQCSSLSTSVIKTLGRNTEPLKVGKTCVKQLEAAATVAEARAGSNASKAAAEAEGRTGAGPPTIRTNTMTGPIDAFRVSDNRGYALYHGKGGLDYSMLMEKEGGEWKVGSLITTEP